MMEAWKELMPVMIQAIKSGQSVAIWYIVVFNLINLAQIIINWTFILFICKGAYSLVKYVFIDEAPKSK